MRTGALMALLLLTSALAILADENSRRSHPLENLRSQPPRATGHHARHAPADAAGLGCENGVVTWAELIIWNGDYFQKRKSWTGYVRDLDADIEWHPCSRLRKVLAFRN